MPRIVKNPEVRRNEILDVALKLLYTKGYEQMTIQDILDEVQISKGALYHYFDSKGAVLEALLERMVVEQVEPLVIPIVQDPNLSALEKLHGYITTAGRWKTSKWDLMIELARVWYSDENAIVRQKLFKLSAKRYMPLIMEIIRQGVREGVFTMSYPDYAGQMMLSLIQGLGDTSVELLISNEAGLDVFQQAENLITAYNDALERILGAPKGSIQLMDKELIKEWFLSPDDRLSITRMSNAEVLPGARYQ